MSKGQHHSFVQPAVTQKMTMQETSAFLMHGGGEGKSLSSAEAGLVPTNWVFACLLASKLHCVNDCLCKQGVLWCWLGAHPIHMVPFPVRGGKDAKRIAFTSCLHSEMLLLQNGRLSMQNLTC